MKREKWYNNNNNNEKKLRISCVVSEKCFICLRF